MKLFLLGVPVAYSNPGVTVHFSQVPHLATFTFGGVVFSESNARTFVIVFVLFFFWKSWLCTLPMVSNAGCTKASACKS